jgi:thioredoxin 1
MSNQIKFLDKLSLVNYKNILRTNPGITIFKIGATWCGPCKKIEPALEAIIPQMPSNIYIFEIDVDASPDIYSFLKNKRIINGIPAILLYENSNDTMYPDDLVIGSDINQINSFFERCYNKANEMNAT